MKGTWLIIFTWSHTSKEASDAVQVAALVGEPGPVPPRIIFLSLLQMKL